MDIHFNKVFVFVTVQLLSVILSDEFLGEMESDIFFESFTPADMELIIYKVKINSLKHLITLETIFF